MKCPPMTEQLKKRISDVVLYSPFTSSLGFEPICVEEDHLIVKVMTGFRFHNGSAQCHGGLFLTLADTAAGLTAVTDGRNYVTQSCSFNFIRPVSEGVVYAEGTVIHRGRTMAVIHSVLTDENGKEVAEGTFNMFKVSDTLSG